MMSRIKELLEGGVFDYHLQEGTYHLIIDEDDIIVQYPKQH